MLSNQRSIYRKPRLNQFGLQLWLDAAADQNFTVVNVGGTDKCTVAKERSQYLREFVQSTPDYAPAYVAGAINSLPALRFNGVDQFMNFSDPTMSWLNNTSFTIFYVATKTTKTNTSMVFGGSSTGIRSNFALGYIAPNTYRVVYGQDDQNAVVPTVAPGDPELYVITYDITDNSREIRRNGLTVGIGASNGPLTNMTDQTLGKYLSTYGQFDLGEIVIYNRALESYERTQVERDLASKWTITDALIVVNPEPEPEVLPQILTKVVSMQMVPGQPPTAQIGTAPTEAVGVEGEPGYIPAQPASPDYVPADPGTADTYFYQIDGLLNPSLSLTKGITYIFNIDAAGYPLRFQTTSGAYDSLTEYTNGVTNAGDDVGAITWAVPTDAPTTLYYVSETEPMMAGTISIV